MSVYDWKINYPVSDLLTACDERIAHHQKRAAFWQGQHDANPTESLDSGSSAVPNYRQRAEQHRESIRKFERYKRFLQRAPEGAAFPLRPDDLEEWGL